MRLGTQDAISMSVDVLEDVECPPKMGQLETGVGKRSKLPV